MTPLQTRNLYETPVAIIDFETTGLTPGYDRVVEVSVVRLDPGSEPKLVFDSLVNPRRKVTGTEVHGITDADVAGAPEFGDIAGDLIDAISGCAVSAYNVYFDMGFLEAELAGVGVRKPIPHFCLMYMRPMLNIGKRCRLDLACAEMGIELDDAHVAAADALASAKLMQRYLDAMRERELETYGDLARLKSYKFIKSFENPPLPNAENFGLASHGINQSRVGFSLVEQLAERAQADAQRRAMQTYWDALKAAVADLAITDDELAELLAIRKQFGITPEQVRALHARIFAAVTARFAEDNDVDAVEVVKLQRLYKCLSTLGWAPGM